MLRVNSNKLNLRSATAVRSEESIIAVLRRGQLLELLQDQTTHPGWWRVRVPPLDGYVAARYVSHLDVPAVATSAEPEVRHSTFRVEPVELFFRRSPDASTAGTVIGVLRHGQLVTKLEEATGGWWFVRADLGGGPVEGFVASRFLREAETDLGPFMVVPGRLNMRTTPNAAESANVIRILNHGQRVIKLSEVDDQWSKVRVGSGTGSLDGYVASRYLTELLEEPPDALRPRAVPSVHLERKGRLDSESAGYRRYPLANEGLPLRTAQQRDAKVRQLLEIVELLDVTHSARYKRADDNGATHCNIYAHDYCYAAGVYLPRVWWMDRALGQLATGSTPEPKWGETVRELNANAIFEWLNEWGDDFGWQHTDDLTEIQDAANDGLVAIICARNRNRNLSGHLAVIVPEHNDQKAKRTNGAVTEPLQCQAGKTNYDFKTAKWWGDQFDGVGFWYTDATKTVILV